MVCAREMGWTTGRQHVIVKGEEVLRTSGAFWMEDQGESGAAGK